MSYALELLRMESEREFWQPMLKTDLTSLVQVKRQYTEYLQTITSQQQEQDGSRTSEQQQQQHNHPSTGLSNSNHSGHRHSYYKCCVNVDVSSLLEHWLGCFDNASQNNHHQPQSQRSNTAKEFTDLDDGPLFSNFPLQLADFINDNANTTTPQEVESWVRKFCTEVGCDVLKSGDSEGKTLLHHLLSGQVQNHLAISARVLLESGVNPNAKDADGNSALHLVKNFLHVFSPFPAEVTDLTDLIRTLLDFGADFNAENKKNRTILSYVVESGSERSASLSRLLINCGARVWPAEEDQNLERSSFVWFLRAQMRNCHKNQLDEDTLYLLCNEMSKEPGRMKQHVDRCMLQLGTSPQAHGPLFRKLRGIMSPYWCKPAMLRQLAVRTVRKSVGPKRLSRGPASIEKLRLPQRLKNYISLEEKLPVNSD